MSGPNKQRLAEILPVLAEWAATIDAMEREITPLRAMFKFVESPLTDAIYALADRYTKAIALQVGDADDWLDYYWNERDMGRAGPTAVGMPCGTEVLLSTIRDLARVIAWGSGDA